LLKPTDFYYLGQYRVN